MHEYSLVQELLARVEEIARDKGATSVRRVHVRLGELCGVEPDLFATAFATFRERTFCGDADLEVRRVAARWVCPRCDRALAPGALLRCSHCGIPAKLAEGDDLILDRVELEVP